MPYPKIPDFTNLSNQLELQAQLAHEYGAKQIAPILKSAEAAMKRALAEVKKLPIDKDLARREPDSLPAIHAARPKGPRRMWNKLDAVYADRLEGALLGRFAGCTLGAPVEFWPVPKMEALAVENGTAFPPVDYWTSVPEPDQLRYDMSPRRAYTKGEMDGVPVDDDITYTLLGLLILEDHGVDFTIDDVGTSWLKYLPLACTAEHVALENLKKGVPALKAGIKNNPFHQWIGADIRSDPWGYAAPGWPEKSAEYAYRDAYISHRRQGIYGEMYFSAVISAAFTVDDPVDALRIGLTEIPAGCALAKEIKWALSVAPEIKDYRTAREAMEKRFVGMHRVHTINNACLTVWGVTIGGTDFTRVIGETVAMGMDNDCTAATAGSIVGAVVGKNGIPAHWTESFNNTVRSYMVRKKQFKIDTVMKRFTKQAKLTLSQES
jgi:ADP-ribosylglycohydrolase